MCQISVCMWVAGLPSDLDFGMVTVCTSEDGQISDNVTLLRCHFAKVPLYYCTSILFISCTD